MNKELYQIRLSIIHEIRRELSRAGFLEVETPILAPRAIPESTIPLFKTRLELPTKKAALPLHLLPSPEYYMKQLLADGWGSIFQFARSFRNNDFGRLHSPEFTMLEYYWVDHDYFQSMDLTEQLLAPLAGKFIGRRPAFRRMSMEDAFRHKANISLTELCGNGDTPNEADINRLKEACRSFDLSFGDDDNWESLFNRIFLNLVEPELSSPQSPEPLFLYDYPAKLQSLSKNKAGTLWTERWELYWQGMELANCFTEERKKQEIDRFFRHEIQAMSDSPNPTLADREYAKKLKRMPPCSGTALGLDRLAMILTGSSDIRDIMPFALALQEV